MIVLETISLFIAGILVLMGGSRACKVMAYNEECNKVGIPEHSLLRMEFGRWEIGAVVGAVWIIVYFLIKAVAP